MFERDAMPAGPSHRQAGQRPLGPEASAARVKEEPGGSKRPGPLSTSSNADSCNKRHKPSAAPGAPDAAAASGLGRWFGPAQLLQPPNEVVNDTVGAVHVAADGSLTAGVSSGGILLKQSGRVGEAAVRGAGCWAKDATAANAPGVAVSVSGATSTHLLRWRAASLSSPALALLPPSSVFQASPAGCFLRGCGCRRWRAHHCCRPGTCLWRGAGLAAAGKRQ